ncbi:HNH endonuclease [Corynebacterium qintianiae]|uniref:HNH endonuclease n=1 Tax=Corynebacterium qintianiae TaxID=2709392 RepID=A0A7T0PE16_9CORY|nr:HNH endonuclease signature motif containing protein [Corynebacterium qintianiae]QPK83488.1 HNH endonuclease [Corynebacterium qintianiae]
MLIALSEFDYLRLAETFGESSTAGWLARETRIAPSTAFEYVGVARQLPDFPLLTEAFRDGAISYSTIRYLLKYLTAENEADLVALARKLCFTELKKALAGIERTGIDTVENDYHHDVRVTDNGDVVITARLNPVDGAAYPTALKIAQLANYGLDDITGDDLADDETIDDVLDDLLADKQSQPEQPPGEEIEPDSQHTRPNLTQQLSRGVSRFGPPVKADMYAALLSMVHMVRTNPVSDLRVPGAHVNIMMTTNGRAWLPGNVAAPSKMLENYVNNAFVRLHLLDQNGLSVHVGRKRRFVTDGQLAALLATWGYECAMPGCNHTRFTEVHHITEWSEGGATDLDNLIPLCSACHSRISNGLVHITTNGRDIEFRFLGGRRYISHAHQLPEPAEPYTGPLKPHPPQHRANNFNDPEEPDVFAD